MKPLSSLPIIQKELVVTGIKHQPASASCPERKHPPCRGVPVLPGSSGKAHAWQPKG